MKVSIELDTEQVALVNRMMERYADRAEDMRPALKTIANDVEREIARSFRSQGGSIGIGWAPLDPKYLAYKASAAASRRGGRDGGPGVFTGSLQSSLRAGGKGHTKRVSRHFMRVGSTAPHAHLFGEGTSQRTTKTGANRGRMPSRPIVRRNVLDAVHPVAAIVAYLASGESPDIPGL